MTQPADAGENSGQHPTTTRHAVLTFLCAAATIAYVHRNSLGVAEETVRLDLGLSLHQMGWVMSSFFWAYALFQIPAGWLGDRWGSRLTLSIYSAVWSVAAGMLVLAGGYLSLFSLRFVSGAAQAGLFPCAAKSISQWYPSTRRGLTSGFLGSFMSVGGAVGAFLTGILLKWVSWEWIFIIYSIPGILWAVWFWRWFRDRPQDHSRVNDAELRLIRASNLEANTSGSELPTATPWGTILSSATMWWICGQQFFRAAGYIFFASWFATYLRETRHVSTGEAGVLTSLPLLAVVVGSPIGGLVTDWVLARTGSQRLARQGVAMVSMLTCAALILLAYFIENPWAAVLVISAGSWFASIGGPCAYAVTMDVGDRHVAAVFSLMNMCGNIGAAVFPVIVPFIVTEGDPSSWDIVLFLFAGIYFAAGACWMCMNPNVGIFQTRDATA